MWISIVMTFLLNVCLIMQPTHADLLKGDNGVCPTNCKHEETIVRCNRKIPYAVNETVQMLSLSEIDSREFYPRRFCHVSWKNITYLSFDLLATVDSPSFRLRKDVFKCLDNVGTFRFKSESLRHFSNETFSGLKNVFEFDLSGCKRISWHDLYLTLSSLKNLPKVSRLHLSGTGVVKPLHLSQKFVNVLSKRRISYLDLSYSSFTLDFARPSKLCETLETFRFTGAQFSFTKKFKNCTACGLLYTVDSSDDLFLKNLMRGHSCINKTEEFKPPALFFRKMRVLVLRKILGPSGKVILSNCSWVLWNNTLVKKFHFSANFLPNFDIRLVSERLELLDLSQDHIESINPNAFSNLNSLLGLDLSQNKLFKVRPFDETFSALFKSNQYLKSIDLSYNKLERLPEDTFYSNNALTKFMLSRNLFKQLAFNITSLLNLTQLDLTYNLIESLNENSRKQVDDLYERQKQQASYASNIIQIDLKGNPFSCTCSSLDFIKWFVSSPVFSASRNTYYCQSKGKKIPMNGVAISVSNEDCRKIYRRRLVILLSPTLPTIGIAAVAVVLVALYKKRKRQLTERHHEDRIRLLRTDNTLFLVFLSYSSQDSDFVERHVLHQLQHHLQAVTKLDRDLVCTAENHFVPSRSIMKEIFRCLSESEVLVAIISRSYCCSRFCQYEIEHAHLLKKPVILIFIEHVDEDEMNFATKEIFQTFTRVKFVLKDGQYKIQPDWPKLCESIMDIMI